jgi:hypothetical protein
MAGFGEATPNRGSDSSPLGRNRCLDLPAILLGHPYLDCFEPESARLKTPLRPKYPIESFRFE